MNEELLTDVVVQREKILDYLLNRQHDDGAGKAKFFLALGFTRKSWEALAEALSRLGISNPVTKEVVTKHGIKYVVDGRLIAPNGQTPWVRTVWIVDAGHTQARLVTAYPTQDKES